MSTLKVNAIQGTDGVERYMARAWVNFNGTGTVAIRSSGNVSSITDLATGSYRVNFTTAMPDANYAITSGVGNPGGANAGQPGVRIGVTATTSATPTTSSVDVGVVTDTAAAWLDANYVQVAIFR